MSSPKPHNRKAIAAIVLALAIGVGIYAVIDPSRAVLMPKCPFKLLTGGLSCPGCGIQRALHAFLTGHFREGLSYNYFLAISLPYLAALVLDKWVLPKSITPRPRALLYNHRLVMAFAILTIAWWIVRNILHI